MLNNFNLRSSINVDSFHLSLFISSIAKSYKFTNRTFRNDPSQLPLVAPFHSFIWFIRSFILRMNHLIHTHVRIVAKFEKAFSIRQTIIDDHSFASLSLSFSLFLLSRLFSSSSSLLSPWMANSDFARYVYNVSIDRHHSYFFAFSTLYFPIPDTAISLS